MLKSRISKKVMAIITAILVIFGILGIMPENVYASTPAYVNWRQTDSRWGSIMLGSKSGTTVAKIGCAATSMCCLWVESGASSEDESVFNPEIGINAMKKAGAFSSKGGITWSTAAKANGSGFKWVKQVYFSSGASQSDKLAIIKDYYEQGYYMHVDVVVPGSTHWVAVRRFVNNKCEIMDTGGTNQTYLSGYKINERIQLYKGPKPAGWRYNPDPDPDPYTKVAVTPGSYYLKNSSTGTYVNASSASNGGAVSLAAKKTTNAFKMNVAGSKDAGYYITPSISSNYVLNPYSDTPGDGTKITLYEKNSDGTQKWYFEKSGSGYIIHNAYNENCVLTASGTGVVLKTKTGAANQIWTLEGLSSVAVKFHRNTSSSDTSTVTETFTSGVANQRFGYNTDGTGKYKSMNAANVGFGQWENPGYELLGWNTDKNATTASYKTYCPVVDSWITQNAPSINFYAIWKKSELSGLSVSTPPTAVIYENGSSFNTNGMVVTAEYACGSKKVVTDYEISYDFSKTGAANVIVSYTEDGITKTATQAVTVQDVFKGSGTEADPYQISTATDLRNLASQINNLKSSASYYAAHYVQTDDIDLENVNWTPIGRYHESDTSDTLSAKVLFDGKYNGNKHKITGLYMDYSRKYAGLFGRLNGNAVIEKLTVEGNLKSTSFSVGGIVGEAAFGSKIINCSFNGTVKGNENAGGIAGKIHNGSSISSCYVNADISASAEGYAGGITGIIQVGAHATSADALIEKSYFAGMVSGKYIGGISGGTQIDTVKECTITYRDCYYLETAAKGAADSQKATGCKPLDSELLRETGAALLKAPFVTADAGVNDGYPVFEWQNTSVLKGDVDNNDAVTVADAVMLQKYLVKSAKLVNSSAGDMDRNGKLNIFDVIILKRLMI